MKKLLLLLIVSIGLFVPTYGQVASQLLNAQSTPMDTSAETYIFVDKRPGQLNRMYLAKMDYLKLKIYQLPWILDSVTNWGDARYAKLLGAYSDPAFVNSLSAGKVFGLSSVALSGSYSDLSGLPNLGLKYDASNPSGYISGITSGMVNAAYGYVPYDAANPSGYITSSALSSYLLKADTTGKFYPLIGNPSNFLITEVDGDITNEIQTLGGSNRTVTLTSGGSFTLPLPNWDSTINKPVIPAQVNLSGGQNTKITGSYPNITIADSLTNSYYNSSGKVNQNIRIWTGTVTPSTSNGYSIDISSAGFTTILSASVIAVRNTNQASLSPNVSIKSKSTTTLVVNIVEDNPATVSILGISVLSGLPSVFANVTGLTLDVIVIGF